MKILKKTISTVGVVGLGLIGGSIAKSIKSRTNCKIGAFDINAETQKKSMSDKIIDFNLDETTLKDCDVLIICLYPRQTIDYVKENLKHIKKDTLIVDCAGVKENICEELSKLCYNNSLNFIGAHPMAGLEKSGYNYSSDQLFNNASMILCEDEFTDALSLKIAEEFFITIGFKQVTRSTPNEHDKIIAFTSQLAHVVSNAYVQSEQAQVHMGFSAGSYQDLTRVAYLNEFMWSELFIENKKPLVKEIRGLISRLEEYASLIDSDDIDALREVLKKGKLIKESIK